MSSGGYKIAPPPAWMIERVKQGVTCRELLEAQGFRVERGGMVSCPFHTDKHPSLKLYGDTNWHCFSCKRGGDVLNLARELYGEGLWRTIRRLDGDFHLGIGIDRRTLAQQQRDARELQRCKAARERKKTQREAMKNRWGALNAKAWGLRERLERGEQIDPLAMVEAEMERDKIGAALEGDIELGYPPTIQTEAQQGATGAGV